MINRILIRIKVIQLLYSYLLTRSKFTIEAIPENASRDRKYAQSFYFDLILLTLELSGYNIISKSNIRDNSHNIIRTNALAQSLINCDDIKSVVKEYNISQYSQVLNELIVAIKASTIYKDFNKIKSPKIEDEVNFWRVVYNTIILKNNAFINVTRNNDDFSIKGFEIGAELFINSLSKICETNSSLYNAHKSLTHALDKSYELYFCIFKLVIQLTHLQSQFIDAAKNKYLPTDEDLNPNTRFIDNQFVKAIEANEEFEMHLSKCSINWEEEPLFLRKILDKILQSDIYQEYMSASTNNHSCDGDVWRNILKNIIFNDEEFNEILESKSSYWNDDLHIIGTFVLKTIKQFSNQQNIEVAPISQYKDQEDADFGPKLFTETIENFDEYRSYIDKFISKQWDSERLAFMDIVIMTTAIAEMIKFPLIPIPVTLNEYIEIANSYSTSKSGQFINGILYSVINYLKSEGKLNK